MQPPFDEHLKSIADSMGISLYQRFTVNEGALFLRCPVTDIKALVRQGKINYIEISANKVEFFGYQLLEYLLGQTTSNVVAPTTSPDSSSNRIVRAREVQKMTGLSRTTIWRLENKGDFPRRVSLGVGSVGWLHGDVKRWIDSRENV